MMGGAPGAGAMFGNMPAGFGMMGAGPPPLTVAQGGPADIQKANTIEFFQPALALIVRGTSRIHTDITGGVIGGMKQREGVVQARERGLVVAAGPNVPKGNVKVAGAQGQEQDVKNKVIV